MKELLIKSKMFVAMLTLMLMTVAFLSTAIQASNSPNLKGSRVYKAGKGYKSRTVVSYYEDNGVGKNVTAYAEINGKGSKAWDAGSVTSNSPYVSKAYPAYHGWGLGKDTYDAKTRWKEN